VVAATTTTALGITLYRGTLYPKNFLHPHIRAKALFGEEESRPIVANLDLP
jgi:hypothetical protein